MPTDSLSPGDRVTGRDLPLADWAEHEVAALAERTGAPALLSLRGGALLGERAAVNGFAVPGRVSAGGGCRLLRAGNGWVALNLARPDDRILLPALFWDADLDPANDPAIAAQMARAEAAALVARGREMGLAIASLDETPISPACTVGVAGPSRAKPDRSPLVVDLSALWAGPLAAHLLWLTGADVVKVESRARPDAMRGGDPALFALLNQGKANVTLDLRQDDGRAALLALIARADIVIEAARPRALLQLGIDAAQIISAHPGLVWATITGHGVAGDAGDWVGFGDDCGVAAGLSAALRDATGKIGFVGDAIADPLTGIATARAIWDLWAAGKGGRLILSMSGTARRALDEARTSDPAALDASLHHWAASIGQPMPGPARTPTAPVAALGQDDDRWLQSC